ncbi:DUF935 domain-containing protein [Pseudovibrio exalbescens]|uniref:DUF935 domain-containing protein n=1 Tax=Pseudovibrio exalbescens TaxID=197461 RepID=UPI002366D76E|nr:DUF935 domain-containing protein [Pseudovibrio exalbescens]MDD7908551.1 DUF935 domain-containing protein [Pseudovibrio exalbescens]
MERSVILDRYGNPIKVAKKDLSDESSATVRKISNKFGDAFTTELTPLRLKRILEAADASQPDEFYKLAEVMEEHDAHYSAVLSSRKRAVSSLALTVKAGSDTARDLEIADAVRRMVEQPDFIDMLDDALDALGKGSAAIEMIWDTTSEEWMPREFIWRDPRLFRFHPTRRRTLQLKLDSSMEGEDLAFGKFITHMPKLKSGMQIRTGLARVASWSYLLKGYTLRGWAAYNEVFGMPLRVGKFDKSASDEDKAKLLRAVIGIANDAAGIIPKEMDIEFITNTSRGGDSLFERFSEYLDKQVSKGVLGQTMTTDDGSSQAQAMVHNDVREDIQKSDARQLANTLNRDVVRPFVDLNFGRQLAYPSVRIDVQEAEDLERMASVLGTLVPLGLKVQMSDVRSRFGFSDPEDGAEVLGDPDPSAKSKTANKRVALARNEKEEDNEDPFDEVGQDELSEWRPQMNGLLKPVRELAKQASSYEEFLDGLSDLAVDMDDRVLAQKVTDAMSKGISWGDDRG